MPHWRLADRALPCGAELGCLIRPGEPYCELTAHKKRRCAQHAPEPAPKVIVSERPVERVAVPEFASLRALGRDWKIAQGGEE